MKRLALLASLVVPLALAGCKKQAVAPPPVTADAAVALAPFTGVLTVERVLAAKDLVKPFDPWAAALARLEAQLGKPTQIAGAKHEWAAMDGDACAYLVVEQAADATVGVVSSPQRVGKDGPVINYRDCLAILGRSSGPAEDPDAPSPPTDGSAVAAATFREVAVKARSRWKDQAVKVAAVYGGATTATSGAQTFVTVTLKAITDDAGPTIKCALATGAAAPTGLVADAAVIASGTVKIDEWMSMGGGDPRLEASLTGCTVEAAPAK